MATTYTKTCPSIQSLVVWKEKPILLAAPHLTMPLVILSHLPLSVFCSLLFFPHLNKLTFSSGECSQENGPEEPRVNIFSLNREGFALGFALHFLPVRIYFDTL